MENAATLPFAQRKIGFNPPTQGYVAIHPKNDAVAGSSPSGQGVWAFASGLRSTNNRGAGSKTASLANSIWRSGSFQVPPTPATLWPATPTPVGSSMGGLHCTFSMPSDDAPAPSPSSSPLVDAALESAVQHRTLARAPIHASPAPSPTASPPANAKVEVEARHRAAVPLPVFAPPSRVLEGAEAMGPSTPPDGSAPPAATAVHMAPQMVWVQMPVPVNIPAHQPMVLQAGDRFSVLLGRAGASAGTPGGPEVSKGSALHGTGKCQPCAWFWKAGRGCQIGAACGYCHLCPEGEIKARKKAKLAAIRRTAKDFRVVQIVQSA
mmetsp:Transcript_48753/g.136399  ORF Transcript_48753/g.136399 Transcript_48753/m.136399 type:complete len:322 (-) Transcript_48753:258-1223(-)